MARLLIVDDEKITRETLRDYVPWPDLGIDAIETANNGVMALTIAKDFNPDIILCDVRMPKMDGIELAAKIREIYPDCKIIFLSGYPDKEYLKSAIQLQAVNYIEKPINFEEIKNVIRHAVNLYTIETQQKADRKKLENNVNENICLIKQRLVLEIVNQKSSANNIKQKYDFPFIKLFEKDAFFVIYIVLSTGKPDAGKSTEAISQRLHSLVYDRVFDHSDISLAAFDESGNIVIVLQGPDPMSDKIDLKNKLAEDIFNQLSEASDGSLEISAGVGVSVEAFEHICDSYNSALDAVSFRFYEGPGRIHQASKRQSSCFNIDNSLYMEFKDLLKRGAADEAAELVGKLAEQACSCNEGNISHIKNIFFNLLTTIYEITKEAGFPEEAQEDDRKYIWQKVEKAHLLTELVDYVLESIRETVSCLDDKYKQNKKIKDIIEYINRQYSNHSLSTRSIANHIFFTQSYLCIFFKKNTGKTLNEYLTEVRIDKAKELMKNKELKLFDIADQVGFSDPNYFSVIFKKHTGYAPSEYRESYLI